MKTLALLVTLFSAQAFAVPTQIILWQCVSVDNRNTIEISQTVRDAADTITLQTNSIPPMPTPPYRGTFKVEKDLIRYNVRNLETRGTLMMVIKPKGRAPNAYVQFGLQEGLYAYNCKNSGQADSGPTGPSAR